MIRKFYTLFVLSFIVSKALAGGDAQLGNDILNKNVTLSNIILPFWDKLDTGKYATRIDMSLSFINSSNQTVTINGLPTFCTDHFQSINFSSTSYKAVPAIADQFPLGGLSPLVDTQRLLALQYLYGNTFGTAQDYFSQIAVWDSYKLMAFQVVVWEISADTFKNSSGNLDFNLSTGFMLDNTSSDPNMRIFADDLLTKVRNSLASGIGSKMSLVVLASPDSQDLLIPYTPILPQPVPEPSTYALVGASSLLALIAYRRRSKLAAKSA